ncbi:MAG TPA: TAT-variant-translocated molybdopterin oxidoreductase [Candidatus Acidoferrales bacterium]|nr:TAT-variant-translocated molybdopterin oxidoreductase [Candidatus Acidoferrales bacterium]
MTMKMPDHEHDENEDLTAREYPLDLQAARAQLRNRAGKEFWRSLEELSRSPHFEELLHREFPRHAAEWSETDGVGRRDFLRLMAASLALAGVSGCARKPNETVLPYVKSPEGLTLGKPLYFATAMPLGASALGLLVESHEGRPTKIEGNPDHPGSLGATDIFSQAAILELYDPDRSQVLTNLGEIRAWSAFLAEVRLVVEALKANKGAGFRILTGSVISPTLGAQLKALLAQFPEAKWHQWEPAGSDGVREGAKLAFGRYVNTIYRVEKADVILSLDADFLASGPGGVRYAREFARRRKPDAPGGMNRLYVVEPTPSVTGATADHRLSIHHLEVETLAYALAGKLGLARATAIPGGQGRWLDAVAKDLHALRGRSLILAGEQQPASVHALAHAMNQALGNVDSTVVYTEPVEAQPTNQLESLRQLAADMDEGKVEVLLILGGNPVYDAPADFRFAERMGKVRTNIHLSLYDDETSQYCQWHIPDAHFLESWSDTLAFDGTASIIQPLIAPLYHAKTAHEVLAAFSDKPEQSSYEIVRNFWKSQHTGADFEKFWRKSLNDGVIAGTAFAPVSLTPSARLPFRNNDFPPGPEDWKVILEVVFRPDPSIYDGRFSNNGWLQEVPKPVSKLAWDNAAIVSPATAEKLGLGRRVSATGGEHGQVFADVVDVHVNGSKVTAAAWILPGQADGVVTLHLGYGRTRAGRVGTQKGFSAYAVRTSSALWSAVGGVTLHKTGETYPLACTQDHYSMEGRELLRAASLSEYRSNPNFARKEAEPPKSLTLYKEFEYPGYAWGMAIDLNACIGCNSCVVACQSENNIPVVGKDQVLRGREMHWIRIDRYYEGALENPETYFQPVPCMQCENAPCEEVCPVGATVHSAEGLNDMVYNRCIGTRYCSNNCPYKVRRFNFLRYQDWETPSLKLMRNPEVTVRSRGVMEKCTYCVQRINNARIESEKQNRPIRDGEIVTACQASCPTEAIVFGNANDPASRVGRLKARPRNYAMLAELNTRPRTTYLAAVRNPNPELEKEKKR